MSSLMSHDETALSSANAPLQLDVVGVGESMLTLYPESPDSIRFSWDVGGAESNVVRTLAVLGQRSGWVSRLGTDLAGSLVHDVIAGSGVDTSLVEFAADAPTGLMLKDAAVSVGRVQYYRAGSAASFMTSGSIPLGHCLSARVLHLSGITLGLSEECRSLVIDLLTEPGEALRSFDINWRPALWPAATPGELFADAANRADAVFVGIDEAEALWGASGPAQVRAVLHRPSRVVVKDGPKGTYSFVEDQLNFEAALQGTIVDPMGAGDAFAAGYLAGLLNTPGDERRSLRLGHIMAMAAMASQQDVGIPPPWPVINRMLGANADEWRSLVYDDFDGASA